MPARVLLISQDLYRLLGALSRIMGAAVAHVRRHETCKISPLPTNVIGTHSTVGFGL